MEKLNDTCPFSKEVFVEMMPFDDIVTLLAAQVGGRCRLTPGTPWLTAVDPARAFRDFRRLKLESDKLLSNVAFNCNLGHYTEGEHPLTLRFERYPEAGSVTLV